MNKDEIVLIMQQQASTLEQDVKNKLNCLMSDDVVFTDVSSYLHFDESQSDALRSAFNSVNASPIELNTNAFTPTAATTASSLATNNSVPNRKSGLSAKIAALRGSPLPGNYLFR